MERLNLNLPEDARKELHRLARRARQRDGEYARELLLKALDESARDDLARQVAETQSPALARREAEIAEDLYRHRHGPAR